MIVLDSLLQILPWNRSIHYTRLGPSHPPAKRTPENQLYAYAICDVSTVWWDWNIDMAVWSPPILLAGPQRDLEGATRKAKTKSLQ